jgi:glycosyltransferase involved in cell wall biosynthesis
MFVRVVDYVASHGGGLRFFAEMIQGLEARGGLRFEVVSHGSALEVYRHLLQEREGLRFSEVPPGNLGRTRTPGKGRWGSKLLDRLLGTPHFHFEVPASVFEGCDLVWFPWAARHRIPLRCAAKAVATLHDVIILEFDGVVPRAAQRGERATVRRWLDSAALIVVDAGTTVTSLGRLFGVRPDRLRVITLSGQRRPPSGQPARRDWPFAGRPYLLCSSNSSPHKNLDVLLAGVGKWGAKVPLVLTGAATDFWAHADERRVLLRGIAEEAGLERGRTLFALDYVDDASYCALLEGAWAVAIPTLAEGAGLPVMEALQQGIPVVSSDIPVAREMVGRMEGEVLWFDPKSPADLAAKLDDLEQHYAAHKAAAVAQVARLRARSWDEVAADYADLMLSAGRAARGGRGR